MFYRKNIHSFVIGLVMVALFVASCSSPQPSSVPSQQLSASEPVQAVDSSGEIKIDAGDFSYTAPDSVSEGWVRVTLTNSGAEPHHVQFMRLNDGVSVQQFEEALKQGEGPAMALVKQMGGVGAVAPTLSAQAILNLPAGEYVILCFIPSPVDQMPHFAKGMIKSLTVQPASGASASEPSADMTVRLKDFSFEMPEALPAGPMTIKVANDGPEPHEFNILRLTEGKTREDVLQFLSAPDGPPPFTPVGGMNGLDVGLSGYIAFDFQPGTYVAICNIPSPKAEGHPHFTLGMVKQFAVASSATDEFPTGKFVLENDKTIAYQFNEDGTFAFYYLRSEPAVEGPYTSVGNLIVFGIVDNENDPKCLLPATYQWSFDGEKLSFAPAGEDTCRPRKDSLADTYVGSD